MFQPASQNKDYWKMIGYREENNKMESSDSYLKRMQPYMRLYGALVQVQLCCFVHKISYVGYIITLSKYL